MRDLLARLRSALQAVNPVAAEFCPPDSPPNYTPYACSYHWFRGPDGRVISIDIIRSDDTGSLGLRVMRERVDGGLDGLCHIAPRDDWEPMRTDGTLADCGLADRPALSRSQQAIAAYYNGDTSSSVAPEQLRTVRFALTLVVEEPGFGSGQLGLELCQLVATDFLRIRYRGYIQINGERLDIDAIGLMSLHTGDKLTEYAYLLAVPPADGTAAPGLLVVALHDDALRFGGELLGARSIMYGYGRHGLPPVSLDICEFDRDIPLGLGGRVELADVRPFFHVLLGQPTCTASARARYLPALGVPVELGRVFLDYRGQYFLRVLGLPTASGLRPQSAR